MKKSQADKNMLQEHSNSKGLILYYLHTTNHTCFKSLLNVSHYILMMIIVKLTTYYILFNYSNHWHTFLSYILNSKQVYNEYKKYTLQQIIL